jgi:hypothetical protein
MGPDPPGVLLETQQGGAAAVVDAIGDVTSQYPRLSGQVLARP